MSNVIFLRRRGGGVEEREREGEREGSGKEERVRRTDLQLIIKEGEGFTSVDDGTDEERQPKTQVDIKHIGANGI